jgi:hypothetical protein
LLSLLDGVLVDPTVGFIAPIAFITCGHCGVINSNNAYADGIR